MKDQALAKRMVARPNQVTIDRNLNFFDFLMEDSTFAGLFSKGVEYRPLSI